jgi:hypothetical protein
MWIHTSYMCILVNEYNRIERTLADPRKAPKMQNNQYFVMLGKNYSITNSLIPDKISSSPIPTWPPEPNVSILAKFLAPLIGGNSWRGGSFSSYRGPSNVSLAGV